MYKPKTISGMAPHEYERLQDLLETPNIKVGTLELIEIFMPHQGRFYYTQGYTPLHMFPSGFGGVGRFLEEYILEDMRGEAARFWGLVFLQIAFEMISLMEEYIRGVMPYVDFLIDVINTLFDRVPGLVRINYELVEDNASIRDEANNIVEHIAGVLAMQEAEIEAGREGIPQQEYYANEACSCGAMAIISYLEYEEPRFVIAFVAQAVHSLSLCYSNIFTPSTTQGEQFADRFLTIWRARCVSRMAFQNPEDVETTGAVNPADYEQYKAFLEGGEESIITPLKYKEMLHPHSRGIRSDSLLSEPNIENFISGELRQRYPIPLTVLRYICMYYLRIALDMAIDSIPFRRDPYYTGYSYMPDPLAIENELNFVQLNRIDEYFDLDETEITANTISELEFIHQSAEAEITQHDFSNNAERLMVLVNSSVSAALLLYYSYYIPSTRAPQLDDDAAPTFERYIARAIYYCLSFACEATYPGADAATMRRIEEEVMTLWKKRCTDAFSFGGVQNLEVPIPTRPSESRDRISTVSGMDRSEYQTLRDYLAQGNQQVINYWQQLEMLCPHQVPYDPTHEFDLPGGFGREMQHFLVTLNPLMNVLLVETAAQVVFPIVAELSLNGIISEELFEAYREVIGFLNRLAEEGPGEQLADESMLGSFLDMRYTTPIPNPNPYTEQLLTFMEQTYLDVPDVMYEGPTVYVRGVSDALYALSRVYLFWAAPNFRPGSPLRIRGMHIVGSWLSYVWRLTRCRFPFVDPRHPGTIEYKAREYPPTNRYQGPFPDTRS